MSGRTLLDIERFLADEELGRGDEANEHDASENALNEVCEAFYSSSSNSKRAFIPGTALKAREVKTGLPWVWVNKSHKKGPLPLLFANKSPNQFYFRNLLFNCLFC